MIQPLVCTWEGLPQTAPAAKSPAGAEGPDRSIKALLGWKGLAIWDKDVDPVDILRAYLESVWKESCGACFPCRLGSEQLFETITRICNKKGRTEDLAQMALLARRISDTAKCEIGRGLAKPVLDIMASHLAAFESVIEEGRPVIPGLYECVVTAPCISACPSHVDIPGYLDGVRMGRYNEALAVVRRDCPMPGTIGRVCVRPCEWNCRRGLLDQPLAVRALKRFLADQELGPLQKPPFGPISLSGSNSNPRNTREKGRVAVVGAGPAGLSCAYYLGLKGYQVTIFEAQEGPGGMAAYGIPSYRLPRDILAYEVSVVEKTGAEIRYGVKVGEDLTLDDLEDQGFQAVFIGVGAPESSKMRCEGEDAGYECFMTGINFLAESSRGQRPISGDKLVVVGGGNVAMDCVRTALRTGFTDVNLLYRRTEAEMPADRQEIEEAKEEGVKFHYLVAPVRVVAQGGKVKGLECRRMKLGDPDASGRRSPVPVEGSEFVIDCDAIIPAVGQICVTDCVLPDSQDLTAWKTLVVDETTRQSGTPNIFGGGDCVTGPATLIAALAAGKEAAVYIDQYLAHGACTPGGAEAARKLVHKAAALDRHEKFVYPGLGHRAEPEVMTPEERIKGFMETEAGLPAILAEREASRCLRCYRIAVAAL